MSTFDPSAAAPPGSGLFGLPDDPDQAQVHVLGVPFDATASYRKGAHRAPGAIVQASHQVDLYDLMFGKPYEAGIAMLAEDPAIAALNMEASRDADQVLEVGGEVEGRKQLEKALERVNRAGEDVNTVVRAQVETVLERDKLPALIGGDHSTPFGAIEAVAERFPGLGVLHFDAHADLRRAYEGFTWSHASILDNVLQRIDGVAKIVQVGVRDLCEEEHDRIRASEGRIVTLFDHIWASARFESRDLRAIIRKNLSLLPEHVYLTFDVDALDPALCPNTGTPVPGGLIWDETMLWLEELARSGKRVVGLDLTEVNPGPSAKPGAGGEDSWDAIVGARLLYRLIGAALATRS